MPEKQNANSLSKVQTMIVVSAIATLFALWNMFATMDQHEDKCEEKLQSVLENTNDNVLGNRELRSLLRNNCLIGTGGS